MVLLIKYYMYIIVRKRVFKNENLLLKVRKPTKIKILLNNNNNNLVIKLVTIKY